MVALAIVLSVVVVLLAVLVAGLLRSHADILKALHDLGVGVGEPGESIDPAAGHNHQGLGDPAGASPVRVPLTIGPPLPGERNSTLRAHHRRRDPERRCPGHHRVRRGPSHPARLPLVRLRHLRRLLEGVPEAR